MLQTNRKHVKPWLASVPVPGETGHAKTFSPEMPGPLTPIVAPVSRSLPLWDFRSYRRGLVNFAVEGNSSQIMTGSVSAAGLYALCQRSASSSALGNRECIYCPHLASAAAALSCPETSASFLVQFQYTLNCTGRQTCVNSV